MEIPFCCDPNFDTQIAPFFAHATTAYVVVCAKMCCDQMTSESITMKWTFHHVRIMMTISKICSWASISPIWTGSIGLIWASSGTLWHVNSICTRLVIMTKVFIMLMSWHGKAWCVTGCEGNIPVTSVLPLQRASNAESKLLNKQASGPWCFHDAHVTSL